MAPQRRSRRGRLRYWVRGNGRRPSAQDSISGEKTRRVLDSYCPWCATSIRCGGPRRIVRCPNTALCGKPLPIDIESTCPNCSHYTRPMDNFCRVCRGSLRNVVRGRGGLYQALRRVPSPNRNPSPPREEVQPDRQQGDMDSDTGSDNEEHEGNEITDSDNDDPAQNPGPAILGRGGGGGGFLRIARIDDE